MKKIGLILVIIVFVFIIQNLLHSIYGLWQKRELLVNARNEVVIAKKENIALKEQIEAVKNPAFIEKQARDKLLLTKPGEQIIVVPDKLIVEKTEEKDEDRKNMSNWQQWLSLFSHGVK